MVLLRRWLTPVIIVGGVLLPAQLPAAAPEKPASDPAIAELGTIRAQSIAAAQRVQQNERAAAALDLAIGTMERGAAAKRQQFEQNGKEEEQLLAALERLARVSLMASLFAPQGPIERVRGGILLAAAIPALQAQAKTLSAELTSLTAEQVQINAGRPELEAAISALTASRETLATLVGKRQDLIAKLLPHDANAQPVANLDELIAKVQTPADPGDQAGDIVDLIKRADTETDRHDKELLARLRAAAPKGAPPPADPTRPSNLRALDAPHTTMVWPVIGNLRRRFGETGPAGRTSQGLTLDASPSGLVVAPFDGEVEYAGNFRGYGLILIIRHGGGYHSLLAGLGRVQVTVGQWLLAGEPVGAMSDADDENAGSMLYLELRRDGRPVDPQSRLASRE
ncbi:MAG TPA: peptidoglycan DD-metalloendopeptidase family protein [Stellaceae bacterium]|nr:peptidoglycan DD-metalloendopeptidase family protein [Stellaceae bacterium]